VHGHLTLTLVSTEWNSGTGQTGLSWTHLDRSASEQKSKIVSLQASFTQNKKTVPKHTPQDSTVSKPTAHGTETPDSDRTTRHDLHARFAMLKSKYYVPSIL